MSSAQFHMKTRASLKYLVIDCLWKSPFDPNSPQTPSKFNFFDNFGNSKVFHTALT